MPSTGLLVALMFVTVLTIGFANILGTLAGNLTGFAARFRDLHIQWKLLLLLQHLALFWNTLVILEVEDWGFAGFLFILCGPVLLFFATSIILPVDSDGESTEEHPAYFDVAASFFRIVALLQGWLIGAEVRIGYEVSLSTVATAVTLAAAVWMSVSKDPKVHRIGTVVFWIAVVGVVVLSEAGLVD